MTETQKNLKGKVKSGRKLGRMFHCLIDLRFQLDVMGKKNILITFIIVFVSKKSFLLNFVAALISLLVFFFVSSWNGTMISNCN